MSLIRQKLDVWLDRSLPAPPVARLLNMTLHHCVEGEAVAEMPVGPEHHNPMGTVHGGILCDLADATMGTTLTSLLTAEETFATMELGAHFFAPIEEGRLTAEARVVRRGRTTAYVECEVSAEAARLLGRFDCTCLIRPLHAGPKAQTHAA
jgi:uncharacterized protein (TIGR00369 family)